GYHGDTSKMFLIGDVSIEDKRLCHVAQECLYLALKQVKPGVQLGEIGTTIEKHIKTNNKNNPRFKFSIVRD
ncbi:M24 family metallopeptidase, partial [Klebsiella pneumoniae]